MWLVFQRKWLLLFLYNCQLLRSLSGTICIIIKTKGLIKSFFSLKAVCAHVNMLTHTNTHILCVCTWVAFGVYSFCFSWFVWDCNDFKRHIHVWVMCVCVCAGKCSKMYKCNCKKNRWINISTHARKKNTPNEHPPNHHEHDERKRTAA